MPVVVVDRVVVGRVVVGRVVVGTAVVGTDSSKNKKTCKEGPVNLLY